MARGQIHSQAFPDESVAMDPQAFETQVENYGVKMVHYRAMRCPVGLADPHDVRRAHDHHVGCSLGFIYRRAGTCRVLMSGNTTDFQHLDPGLIDGSKVRVTFPRFYEDKPDRRVHVSYADRLYFAEPAVEVPDWQTLRAHETGRDRLQFPAVQIEHVIDSAGREYDPALYEVRDGDLVWLTPDRPLPGTVLTCWYLYEAFYYVDRLINQVRVAQVVDLLEGPRVERMMESALLARENVFRNSERDDLVADDKRQQPQAESGGFGPR